mgnify:CR=1
MIDFLMTTVKSAAQLIYILTVFGIIITSIQVLQFYLFTYQSYYGYSYLNI